MTVDPITLAVLLLASAAVGAFVATGAIIRAGVAMLRAQRKAGSP